MKALPNFCIALAFGAFMSFAVAPTVVAAQDDLIQQTYRTAEESRKAARTPEEMAAILATYEELAQQGHARSAFRAGSILYRGTLVAQDSERGIAYYREAAEQGFDPAWRYLGNALLRERQGEEAFDAFERAAAAGITGSELNIAKAHVRRGFGTKSDPETGLALMQQLSDAGETKATIELSKVYTDPRSGFSDFTKARETLEPLAEAGDPAALERLANIYRSGQGVPRSYPTASDYFQRAAEAGAEQAILKAVEMEIRRGRRAEALAMLEAAVADRVEDADLALVEGHIRRSFGRASDRELGRSALKRGVDSGDLRFVLLGLDLRVDGQDPGVEVATLMAMAEVAADNGNQYAAADLLRFVRSKPRQVDDALNVRKDYLARYRDVLRPHTLALEEVHMTLDTSSLNEARTTLLRLVTDGEADVVYNTLVASARADRNMYIYLLQNSLGDVGAYQGRTNGLLTRSTLRAILSYCRQNGYLDECRHGPLRGSAVRLVSASLADQA